MDFNVKHDIPNWTLGELRDSVNNIPFCVDDIGLIALVRTLVSNVARVLADHSSSFVTVISIILASGILFIEIRVELVVYGDVLRSVWEALEEVDFSLTVVNIL